MKHIEDDKYNSFTLTNTCLFCSMKYARTGDNRHHMAINHTEVLIIPYMKEKNLWINAPPKNLDNEKYPVKKLRIDVKNQKLKSVNEEEKVVKPGPASRRKLAISAAKSPSPRSPLRSRISKAEPTKNKDDVKENFLQNPLFNSQVKTIFRIMGRKRSCVFFRIFTQ